MARRWPIATPAHARDDEQRERLKQSLATGQCSFCPGGDAFSRATFIDHPCPDLWAIENSWPHAEATRIGSVACHWVIFPKRCISDKEDLTNAEWNQIFQLMRRLQWRHQLDNLWFYTRSGNPAEAATTITHWHAQCLHLQPGTELEVYFGKFQQVGEAGIRNRPNSGSIPLHPEGETLRHPYEDSWQVVWHPTPLEGCHRRRNNDSGRLQPTNWLISPTRRQGTFLANSTDWQDLLRVQQWLRHTYRLSGSFLVGSTGDYVFEAFSLCPGRAVKFRFQAEPRPSKPDNLPYLGSAY